VAPSQPSRLGLSQLLQLVSLWVLLHAIEVDNGEEPALCIQVAEGQHMSLPRKPKQKVINTFVEWVTCFCVCYHPLCLPASERNRHA